jgi:hypothetical protein
VLPLVRKMTPTEQRLLSDVLRHDELMREAVIKQEWDMAASRWNSFIQRCCKDSQLSNIVRTALHAVHGDILRSAVAAINTRREAEAEHQIISMKATQPELKWDYVAPAMHQFTPYEDVTLIDLVKKHTSAIPRRRRVSIGEQCAGDGCINTEVRNRQDKSTGCGAASAKYSSHIISPSSHELRRPILMLL